MYFHTLPRLSIPSTQQAVATVASSSILDAISDTTRTLFGDDAANNITAAFSEAGKAVESFFSQSKHTVPAASSTWHEDLYENFNNFLASRSSLENTSLLLGLCTFLFLLLRNMSSWTRHLGNLGRFSPFTRSPNQSSGSAKVSDSDFSYITADDLRRHQQESISGQQQTESPTDYGPQRDTDMLTLRNKRKDYAVHFPAYSIAKGELMVGNVREAAAKKMSSTPSKVKLLYKGKNLKDDGRTCKQEGLRDGSEIMCTVAEGQDGDSDSYGDEEDVDDGGIDGEGTKRRRNRGKKTKRRNRREAYEAANSGTSTPENLAVPNSQNSTRAPSPKPPPTPATPIDKLNALHNTLMSYDRDVQSFLSSPPPERAKKEFEHKRLSETILTQVLLKLDAVETEGDADARARRKQLVKETQGVLNDLDAAMKR